VDPAVLSAAQNYTLNPQYITFGMWLSIHHLEVHNSNQEFANSAQETEIFVVPVNESLKLKCP